MTRTKDIINEMEALLNSFGTLGLEGNDIKDATYLKNMKGKSVSYVRDVLKIIENVLLDKSDWFPFSKDSTDGRTNSQKDESLVTNYLLNHSDTKDLLVKKSGKKSGKKSTEEENNRAFGDISINLSKFEEENFPCNIKIISETNKSGNNACGLIPLISYTFQKPCKDHENVMNLLVDIDENGFNSNLRLYGIIMIQKENKKCWVGTFDEVPDAFIGTNPSNPLQIPFLKESDRVERSDKEYINILVHKIVEYHTKKSAPFAIWSKYQSIKASKETHSTTVSDLS